MMANFQKLSNTILKSRVFCCFVTKTQSSLQLCSFSTSNKKCDIYKDYAHPDPDPNYYYNNRPKEGDEEYIVNVRPAPTSHTYSNFFNPVLFSFERLILKKGKSPVAKKIMNETLQNIKAHQIQLYHKASDEDKLNIECNPTKIFLQAIENAKPVLTVKTVRQGGAAYRVPYPLSEKARFTIACKWLIGAVVLLRQKNPISDRLANEILSAYKHEGVAVTKKINLHREAEANRAYANYRWTENKRTKRMKAKRK